MAGLEIEEILSNSNSRIRIQLSFDSVDLNRESGGESVTISGYNTGNFSVSVANQYNNPLESSAINALESQLQLAQAAAKSSGFNALPPVSIKAQLTTINNWTGSQRPQFNVSFFVVAFRKTINVLDDVDALNKLFYPLKDTKVGATTLRPPGGYGVNFDNDLRKNQTAGQSQPRVSGTVALRVGDWFQATNLNPVNLSYDISKETLENGLPLYAQINISLTPYKMPTADEVSEYFNPARRSAFS